MRIQAPHWIFWTFLNIFEQFLAFRRSKNAFPGFVCIPLCLLSEVPPGGKPSIAFLKNLNGCLSDKRPYTSKRWKKCIQVWVAPVNLCPRPFLTSSLDSPPSNQSTGPRTADRLNYFLFFYSFERYQLCSIHTLYNIFQKSLNMSYSPVLGPLY